MAGYNIIPRGYDSPLPQRDEMDWEQLRQRRPLPGIDLQMGSAVDLLNTISCFAPELDSFSVQKTTASPFWLSNGWFEDFDVATLHCLLRHLKPKRYVELGCGFSSFVSSHALQRNAVEGFPCDALYADPFPRRDISEALPIGHQMRVRSQDLSLEYLTGLEEGDVLFVDTSHVLKVQSDVVHQLTHIFPLLKPGVWIHIHDIFTPYDYLEEWIKRPLSLTSNEQYAVECLLSGGNRYRVELPLYMLWREQPETLLSLLRRGKSEPHSFWIRKQI